MGLMRVPEISLLDHLPGYIGWKDLNRHYVGANKALLELKGFRHCVFLLIRGKSAKEIEALLSISKRTVESYIENIKNKMDCRNKAEILVKAVLNSYHNHIPARLNQAAVIKSL